MSRKLLAGLATAIAAAALAVPAVATPPHDGGGVSFLMGRTVNDVRQSGPHTFIDITDVRGFVGTLSGTAVEHYTVKVTGDEISFHGTSAFTGTVDGRPGTFVMRVDGKGSGPAFADHRVSLSGTATGALEGLHMNIDVVGANNVGQYEARVHFDP